MKTIISFLLLICLMQHAQAQIQWQHCYGGTTDEMCFAIRQTFDSGNILAGYALSSNDDVSGNHGSADFWVVKITATGAIEWQKCYGGSGDEEAFDVRQTTDSGYIVVGYTYSNDGDASENHGNGDMWVIKISSSGALQWQKCLGGSGGDGASSVRQTDDGGYIIAGTTTSDDEDVSGNHGGGDIWVVKLTDTGSITWAKCYGGKNLDEPTSVQQTFDGGYIVGGITRSHDFDVTGYHGGSYGDIWVLKLSPSGSIQWEKCLGGSKDEFGGITIQTNDGGYIVAGQTSSDDGDVTCYTTGAYCDGHGWVVKLTNSGSIQWNTCVSITGGDCVKAIEQTTDGGYIIAGYLCMTDGYSGSYFDALFGKLTNTGGIDWVDRFGANEPYSLTKLTSVAPTSGGTGIAAGYTVANDGAVSGNHGGNDYWVVKFGLHTGVANIEQIKAVIIAPNPVNEYVGITAPDVITSIVVTNMMGQTVYSNNKLGVVTFELDIHDWMNGMYFIKVNGRETGKFVKE